MKMTTLLAVPATLFAIGACNGESSAQSVAQLRIQAAQAKVEALKLAVATPCGSDSECSVVALDDEDNACRWLSYSAYSLVSPTAGRAEAAAARERELAAETRVRAGQAVACPQILVAPQRAICQANRCVSGPSSFAPAPQGH